MKINFGPISHNVIGQEFDKVVALIGPNFYYNEQERLKFFSKTHYNPEKMLYQAVTRTRDKIMIIIVNNPKVMNTIMGKM